MRRVLAIFLDGYEHQLGQRFMSAGEMPELSSLAAQSARFLLDHGAPQRTGLAGEHISTGLSPDAARRWSQVHFDPQSYSVQQEGTRLSPFTADLPCQSVVFDAPYFDVLAAPNTRGIVSWGAHDPGISPTSRPSELAAEIDDRFGPYPATRWTYGFVWPSEKDTRTMGFELAHAVDVRADVARWLLKERYPDWDLGLVAVGEPHSAIEALWHGIDPAHQLHYTPGAPVAAMGIHAVYRAVDRLIGELIAEFPDAIPVVFATGGMGVNTSDVPSMLLLPELMYRRAFGTAFFKQPQEWNSPVGACPFLPSHTNSWDGLIGNHFPIPRPKLRTLASRVLPEFIKAPLRKARERTTHPGGVMVSSLAWMPATAYQPFWHSMPAFALPSFYDGRVRLNLIGRERRGVVSIENYRRVLADVEELIRACVDPATGEGVVDSIEYPALKHPRELPATRADLNVVWKGTAVCLEHPTLGRLGPVPYRRTGGHTGPFGMAYIRADDIPAGDRGIRSTFDVVPTIIELLGQPSDGFRSGKSLLSNSYGESENVVTS
jgi:predicted AlkP superfamily phosphohydrolase/phosphomutase